MFGPSWYPTALCQGKNSFVPNSCHVAWPFNALLCAFVEIFVVGSLGLGWSTRITMDNFVRCVACFLAILGLLNQKEIIQHHIYF